MKPFNLEEYAVYPTRKVVTRENIIVEIIETNGREPFPVVGYIGNDQIPLSWCSNGRFQKDTQTIHANDLFFADEEDESTRWLPSWRRAKAGTKLPSEAVIIYDIDPEPRLGKVMVNDGRYMLVKELEELPEE